MEIFAKPFNFYEKIARKICMRENILDFRQFFDMKNN